MNTEDLEVFVEVADAGGVSPAARRLGLSKSVVSRRLARLEAELGVQLIARTTRGAALTEAGLRFREHAERITGQVEAAQDSVRPEGDLRGRFRVALPVTFGPTLFAPILTRMAAENPRLHVQASYSDRFIDLVSEGFDCAVRVGHLADSSLVARRVGVIHGKLVASPAYLARHGALETLEQLVDHDVLMQGTEQWRFMDGDDIVTVQPQGRFKADNAEALVVAALAGMGIARVPDCLTYRYLASGELVSVLDDHPPPPAGAYVVRSPGQYTPRKVRVLADRIAESFEREPELWGTGG